MKKLLALVLCVVMVMSLAPAAFANTTVETTSGTIPRYYSATYDLTSLASTSNANKAIGHAKDNIEYLYGVLAADTAIFDTVKSIDTMVGDIATQMFDGAEDLPWITASALKGNTKLYMKDFIGSEIVRYMNSHSNDYASTSVTRKTGAANTVGLVYLGNATNSTTGRFANIFQGANGVIYAATETTPGSGVYNWQKVSTDKITAANVATVDLANFTWADGNNDVTGGPGAYSQKLASTSSLTYTGRQNANGAYLYTDANGVVYAASVVDRDRGVYNWQVTNGTLAQALAGTAVWSNATVTENTAVKVDPIDYVNTFANAVNSAFTSEKAAANLENLMYQLYTYKVWADIDDKLEDLYDDIKAWENGTNILNQYHFREGMNPYIFLNDRAQDLPETVGERLPSTIWAP